MSVLTVPEAKKHLNIEVGTYDDEIQDVIDAAEAAIAQRCGPLEPTVVTTRALGNGGTIALPHYPVVSLTSITPEGSTALDISGVYADSVNGVLSYSNGATFATSTHTVVYTAGRASCPPDLLMAVKELVKHLWQPQRGGSKRPGTGGGDSYSNTVPGAAYAFPFRVEQLIAPHEHLGFA